VAKVFYYGCLAFKTYANSRAGVSALPKLLLKTLNTHNF
jgi:hypothetical protein